MKQIVLLGSTGSIGDSTLDIVAKFPDQFSILGLATRHSDEKLAQQIRSFPPKFMALADSAVQILDGPNGVTVVAAFPESDLVISAIVWSEGPEKREERWDSEAPTHLELEPLIHWLWAGRVLPLAFQVHRQPPSGQLEPGPHPVGPGIPGQHRPGIRR